MNVRPARIPARESASKEISYRTYTFPGPSGGWVSDSNLTVSQPGCAIRLENIFPTATGGILRRGCIKRASIAGSEIPTKLAGVVETTEGSPVVTGVGTSFVSLLSIGSRVRIDGADYEVLTVDNNTQITLTEPAASDVEYVDIYRLTIATARPVETLISYDPSADDGILFAATSEGVWDISEASDPVFSYAITHGDLYHAQYTTVNATRYYRFVNGVDEAFVFDGEEFSAEPSLTFSAIDHPAQTLTSADLSFVWVFKNRFFFVEKGTLNFWYLQIGNVGGELRRFSLGGEFKLGGTLIYGSSWSMDSGDGFSAMCAFFTDRGEVAVYRGDDPSDATAWSIVGVYQIGKPFGPRSFVRRGGDILAATDVGLIPLSGAVQREADRVALSAISAPIRDDWRDLSVYRPGDWPMDVWTANQMLAIALPESTLGEPPIFLIANVETNKWAVYTGWSAICLCVHGERMFFGTSSGDVFEANVGGLDDNRSFVGVYVPVFDQMQVLGEKTTSMARAVVRSDSEDGIQLTSLMDFDSSLPPPPDAPASPPENKWGTAKWGGGSKWVGPGNASLSSNWVHVSGGGEVISIAHQVTSGTQIPRTVEFIRTDVLFTTGEVQS